MNTSNTVKFGFKSCRWASYPPEPRQNWSGQTKPSDGESTNGFSLAFSPSGMDLSRLRTGRRSRLIELITRGAHLNCRSRAVESGG